MACRVDSGVWAGNMQSQQEMWVCIGGLYTVGTQASELIGCTWRKGVIFCGHLATDRLCTGCMGLQKELHIHVDSLGHKQAACRLSRSFGFHVLGLQTG